VKFYTPEKTVLMDITAVKSHPDGLLIEGKIMGAMPMKAILHPEEMRKAFKLMNRPLYIKVIGMLLRRQSKPGK
jgi:hypothetical protein